MRIGQNIRFGAKGQLLTLIPFSREFERVADAALNAFPGVAGHLESNLVHFAFVDEFSLPDVETLIILPNYNKIDLRRALVPQRGPDAGIKFYRPQIDVLL